MAESSSTPQSPEPCAASQSGPSVRSRCRLLSKSRYLAGLQCPKRLWLRVHEPQLATAPDAARQALFDTGTELGRHARSLWPGGVLVPEGPESFEAAAARTRDLLRDPTVPALLEPAFEHRGVRVRVDILERRESGRWSLVEAKSGTRTKEVDLDDLAVQRFVLEGCGIRLATSELLLVDCGYVRGLNGIDWPRYFRREDQSAAVAARLAGVGLRVDELAAALAGRRPGVEPGPHCRKPHGCEFWQHCTGGKPADWVHHLPRLRCAVFEDLRAAGVERIGDIPDHVSLTPVQARVREALRSGRLEVSRRGLADALRWLGPPAFYLDFETMSPAVPLYPGTRPYERIPFQWSLHQANARGRLAHRGFLASGRGDPRRATAESLVFALRANDLPVAVYSSFEASVLRDLAVLYPDLAPDLRNIGGRLVDLLPLVRDNVYHPAFGGSFSLKAVAPALVPGFAWAEADVGAGAEASLAFERIARGGLAAAAERVLARSLQAYCKQDTLALAEVHRALGSLV